LIIESFFAEALDVLRKHGLSRRPDQTPLEFAESLGMHPVRHDFTSLTLLYNRMRFGAEGSAGEIDQARRMLKSLRQTVAAKRPGTQADATS
jgi:hypothetical protein